MMEKYGSLRWKIGVIKRNFAPLLNSLVVIDMIRIQYQLFKKISTQTTVIGQVHAFLEDFQGLSAL